MRASMLLPFAGLAAGAMVLSACPFVPCETFSRSETIAGTWTISTVNGQSLPGNGLTIPNSSDRLVGGQLTFVVERVGPCGDKTKRESGSVIAEYDLVASNGSPKPRQTYAGAFRRIKEGGSADEVTVMANGRSAEGTSGGGTLAFSGTLPQLGGLTVAFRR